MNKTRIAKAFRYLDRLRESGRTNMWAAYIYLEREAGYERYDAIKLLGLWMDTFGDESPEERAALLEWKVD